MRADSFRNATIDPVKVTAPMKTPMKTSAWWMPTRFGAMPSAVERAVPADEHRRKTDEAVEQGDELRHRRSSRRRGRARGRWPPPMSTAPTRSVSPSAACGCPQRPGDEPDRRDERDRHAGDAVEDAAAGGLVLAEARETQDEQQRGDDVGGAGERAAIVR